MKAIVHVGNITIELEEAKQKDLFKAVTSVHEVFGEKCCGLCKSEDIVPVWRQASKQVGKKTETYDYPEWRCNKCFARLSMGTVHDETGTLFPQRRLVNGERPVTKEDRENGITGEFGDHNGWYKFRSNKNNEEQPQKQQSQRSKPAPRNQSQDDGDIPF